MNTGVYYMLTPHIHVNNICNQNTDISTCEFYYQLKGKCNDPAVVIEAINVFCHVNFSRWKLIKLITN